MAGLFPDRNYIAVGYRSHESGQNEVYAFQSLSTGVWVTLYTVPAGKTLYLTKLVCGTNPELARTFELGVSDTTIFRSYFPVSTSQQFDFNVPMKFTAGTVVQAKATNGAGALSCCMSGFLE